MHALLCTPYMAIALLAAQRYQYDITHSPDWAQDVVVGAEREGPPIWRDNHSYHTASLPAPPTLQNPKYIHWELRVISSWNEA